MPLIIRGNVMQSRGRVDWLPDANATQPAMTFVSDPDTGIYHPGENQLALVTGGADRLVVHDLGTTITGNVTGGSFVGDGASLTSLNASNLATGTVDVARLPDASTSAQGVVQLSSATNSTSTTLAATASAVKAVNDNANTRALQTTTVSAGTGLTGGGSLASNRTISHADTSTQTSITSTAPTMIQNVAVDGFGHVTGMTTYNLDTRYYTESESDARFVNVTGDTMTGSLTVNGTVTANVFLGDGSQLTGIAAPMTLTSVQITDASFVPIDDTALTSNVGGYFLVNGTNFAPGSIAIVGGTNASATAYHSSTQLRVQAPSKASGSYTVSVVRSGDGSSASLPSGVTYSEGITWITGSNLPSVTEDVPFSIPIQATSDSTVSYSNVSQLPPSTSIDPVSGNLTGTISGVNEYTFYSFDVKATDAEYQDATRSFFMNYLIGVKVEKIAAGRRHTLVLSDTGRLFGFGNNQYGESGTTGSVYDFVRTPVEITQKGSLTGRTIIDIRCMNSACTALMSDGGVVCWGLNGNLGQCGQGNTTTSYPTPVAVTGGALSGKHVVAIASGYYHVLALDDQGKVYAWGFNSAGQCGQGDVVTPKSTPVAITGGSLSGKTVTKIGAGSYHSFAICSDNTVHVWGGGSSYELGTGGTTNQTLPYAITNFYSLIGKTVVDIQGGTSYTVFLCSDNTVHTVGLNTYGQCGVGSTNTVTGTTNITNNGSLSGRTVDFISCGGYTTYARCTDGTIHAWGIGTYGSVGDGGTTDRTLPVEITQSGALAGKTLNRFANGGGPDNYHQFAIVDDGREVVGWGYNTYYQVGDTTTTDRPTPIVTPNIKAKMTLSRFTASDGAPNSQFGFIAVNAAGTVVLVGARGGQGAAYIFTKSGGGIGWTQVTKLTPDDPSDNKYFGSVALNDAGTVALIGAYGDDASRGACYVFTESGGTWTQRQKLVAGDSQVGAGFGVSVAMNAAGTVAIVGAFLDDGVGGAGSGACYVFTESGGTWTQTQKLMPGDSESAAQFGQAVTMNAAGDVVGIGAPQDDASGGVDSGACYIFAESGGTWTQRQKLVPGDSQVGAWFGLGVDLNAAGTVASIGAGIHDGVGANSGAAYIYTESGGVWTETTTLVPTITEAEARFGWDTRLNAAGDIAIVGAYGQSTSVGADSGVAFVFRNIGGSWVQTTAVSAETSGVDGHFGIRVAMNSTGNFCFVGATAENSSTGAVYEFQNKV